MLSCKPTLTTSKNCSISDNFTKQDSLYENLSHTGLVKNVERIPVRDSKVDGSTAFSLPAPASPFNSNRDRNYIQIRLELTELGKTFIEIMSKKD